MKPTTRSTLRAALAVGAGVALGAGCGAADEPEVTVSPLTAVCTEGDVVVANDWWCGVDRVAECNGHFGTHVDYIDVPVDLISSEEALACADVDLVVSHDGPFAIGDTTIVVHQHVGDADLQVCSSQLTIVDTTPPAVTVHDYELWEPNHKLHTIVPEDCLDVVDACDPDVAVWFTGAASDEPVDELGDGHSEPDIVDGDNGALQLRAERSGTGNGRVYSLDWHAEDIWGNWVKGVCRVIVPHDQGAKDWVQDDEAYRVVVQP